LPKIPTLPDHPVARRAVAGVQQLAAMVVALGLAGSASPQTPLPPIWPVAMTVHVVPAGFGLPPGVPVPPAGTSQLVTVLVPTARSTSGVLRGWRRESGGQWTSVLGPVTVRVGTAGVGATQEGTSRTPRGTFDLPSAFGRQPNPGTRMLYRQVGTSDWWVSDPHSPSYNTYRHCAPGTCDFNESAGENLGRAGPSYDYAVVIGYNTTPVRPGAGSAFFVHVDAGVPSQGCVEVPRTAEVALLRWLDPAQHPRITIGLG
jgi:L,D-peptidoglycan transpeptidase YkuD (ErfK/YbiS/YcfS/YnhG family)